jgi:hypothetical protein
MENKQVAVLVPIHEYNNEMEELLIRAIKSVPSDYTVYVAHSDKVESDDLDVITKVHADIRLLGVDTKKKGASFSVLVNKAFSVLLEQGVEWCYLLEFDDEFNTLWFDEVNKEREDKPDVGIFIPLTEIIDFNENRFLSYGNEAPWASSFSNQIGYIDNESLQQFFDFYMTGSVFNLRDWNYAGGLKESIKLSFWYEFLLRFTHNGKKAYVIPKLGYKHYVNRPNSLHMVTNNDMSQEEKQWWYELALEEYTYKKDRKKEYKV